MAKILYGKPVADAVFETVKSRLASIAPPSDRFEIASLRAGEGADDIAYERSIARACEKVGIVHKKIVRCAEATTEELIDDVIAANDAPEVLGTIVFQPMPKGIDSQKVCNSILPEKDIDCSSDLALGDMLLGNPDAFAPSTAEASLLTLSHYGIGLEGAHVVVIGRSRVIGKPAGILALGRNATVTFCHSRTKDLKSICKMAEIVICAVGSPRFFNEDYFREGQIVIDVGMNVDENGSLCGDVAFDEVEPIVEAITPVPKGIGSVTTAILLEHATRNIHGAAEANCEGR